MSSFSRRREGRENRRTQEQEETALRDTGYDPEFITFHSGKNLRIGGITGEERRTRDKADSDRESTTDSVHLLADSPTKRREFLFHLNEKATMGNRRR